MDRSLVYDVGAHRGEDTEFYLQKGFRVIAIEANPNFCSEISERFSSYVETGKLIVLNVAVANASGPIDFYIDNVVSVWGTTNLEWVRRNSRLGAGHVTKMSVRAERLADIMNEYGVPHYCKIDIEGNDFAALESLANVEEPPSFVSIESEKLNWNDLVEELKTFRQLGYKRYKIIDQTLVPLQKCPAPPREGAYVDFQFEGGSSGLFGDELPGDWMDFFDAIEAYKGIFRGYALHGDNGLFRGTTTPFHLLGKIQQMLAGVRGQKGYKNPADIFPPAGWYDTHARLAD
jgi:FkbM family methyltransferase